MKTLLLGLIAAHCVTPFAFAAPSEKLGDFELTDQEAKALFFDSAFVRAIDFKTLGKRHANLASRSGC
jgi:hypothetical protein